MATRPSNPILFEDVFEVLEKDPGGKKFDGGEWMGRDLRSGGRAPPWYKTLWHRAATRRIPLRFAVSRFICHSDLYEMDLHVDINTDLFPLEVGGGGGLRCVACSHGLLHAH